MHHAGSADDGCCIQAKELAGAVLQIVGNFLRDELRIIDTLQLPDTAANRLQTILRNVAAAADDLTGEQPERRRELLHLLVHRVTLDTGSSRIEIKRSGLHTLVSGSDPATGEGRPDTGAETPEDLVDLTAPIYLKRRGVEAKLVIEAARDRLPRPDQNLVALVAKAFLYIDDLAEGRAATVRDLAQQNKIKEGDVSQILPLAFFAPDIIETIVSGRQVTALAARGGERLGGLGGAPGGVLQRFHHLGRRVAQYVVGHVLRRPCWLAVDMRPADADANAREVLAAGGGDD